MDLETLSLAFARAGALGFMVAAPIGPVGALCISRTLGSGSIVGLATGVGAATVHAGWTLLILLGLAKMADPNDVALIARGASIVGAILLTYVGAMAFARPGALIPQKMPFPTAIVCFSAFLSGVGLTGANPTTPLLFLTAIPALVSGQAPTFLYWLFIAIGTFIGSVTWWVILSSSTSFLRHRVTASALTKINKLTGMTIIALAALLLSRAL